VVVAGRPSSRPAAASTNAPVQIDTMRAVAEVLRSKVATSFGRVPSVIADVP
jgi:hypothetical protein